MNIFGNGFLGGKWTNNSSTKMTSWPFSNISINWMTESWPATVCRISTSLWIWPRRTPRREFGYRRYKGKLFHFPFFWPTFLMNFAANCSPVDLFLTLRTTANWPLPISLSTSYNCSKGASLTRKRIYWGEKRAKWWFRQFFGWNYLKKRNWNIFTLKKALRGLDLGREGNGHFIDGLELDTALGGRFLGNGNCRRPNIWRPSFWASIPLVQLKQSFQ